MGRCYRIMLLCVLLALCQLPISAAEADTSEIQVYIQEPGVRNASVSMSEPHRWVLCCSIPEPMQWQIVTVIQTLSPDLTYVPDSLDVILHRAGECISLAMEQHYTFTGGSVFTETGTADRICVTLTEEGYQMLTPEAQLRISYGAELKDTAPVGTQILGTAQMNCTDKDGKRFVFLSDKATVSTGGVSIQLMDSLGESVPGAMFMIAREATELDLLQNKAGVEILDTGEEVISVVYVSFLDAAGNLRYVLETDRKGVGRCWGLKYGTYYLVQTEHPEGMGLPVNPVKITVNEVSHLTAEDGWKNSNGVLADNTVSIHSREVVMPQTGGPGTYAYTVSGTIVIMSACLLLWLNRNKKLYV